MPGGDFSSGVLIRLVLASFKRQGILPELDATLTPHKDLSSPHVSLPIKRELLKKVFDMHGALPIIQAGFDIQRMPENPLSFAMLRSPTVLELVSRFFKLQKYFHSKHRLQLISQSKDAMVMRHISKTSKSPEIYEDILLGALMAGILSQYGCQNVSLCFAGETAIKDGHILDGFVPPVDCSSFSIVWQGLIRPANIRLKEEVQKIGEFTASNRGYYSAKISKAVAADPLEKWSLADMAVELSLSVRTLQRRLYKEGTTFGECILVSRCQCAAYYMTTQRENLTAVGFLAGFSDAAHFSREFKKNVGLLPSNYQSSLSPIVD